MGRGQRQRLLFIGAVPPPYHGVAGANALLLQSPALRTAFVVRHLDLTDRRPISRVEKFDWRNVWLALRHGVQAGWALLTWRPAVTYLCLSQNTLGFLRDALFLVPARLLGRRTVLHLHGGNFQEFDRRAAAPVRWLIRFSLARTARFVVLGECLRETVAGLVPPDRVVVVPNGVPDWAGPARAVTPAVPRAILYLGTITRAKGIDVFLEAAGQVLANHPAQQFLVAGPWYRADEQAAMLDRVRARGWEQAIQFVGEVSGADKTRVLESSAILVFPSVQQEGQPLTVLEAMCGRLAVVATDRGCLREVVHEGVTGFVVPPGDPAAIAARLDQLLADPALCARLGRAGRQRYEECYRDSQFAARLVAVFREVAGA